MENNGDLTYLGQAIKILDNLSNKNENILSICIDEYDDIFILKSLLILYDYYIQYFAMNEPKNVVFQRQYGKYDESSYLNIIFNRQYGKNKETYLIKYVKKKDLKTIKYLLDELCRGENKLNLDIYKGDCNNQNMLHHAVLLKQKEIIKYLIKYDSDNNFLKTNKDSKGKSPIDLDRTKTFENEYYTVWDAAKKNDVNLLKKLIKELKYYEVNEQTYINKNTPLHMAVKYKADRAILYLLKEGGDKEKKNINGYTPLDTIEKVQFPDRKWIKVAKKILDKEIKEFVQLDKLKVEKYMDSNNASKISNGKEKKKKLGEELKKDMRILELLSMIKEQINYNKINIKELFEQLDKNKNGRLSFKEFKKLFTNLNIEKIKEEDITYIMSHLDSNKDGKLQYKEFLNLLI
jgi:Ca2+-binding EF-hand superfamily protein